MIYVKTLSLATSCLNMYVYFHCFHHVCMQSPVITWLHDHFFFSFSSHDSYQPFKHYSTSFSVCLQVAPHSLHQCAKVGCISIITCQSGDPREVMTPCVVRVCYGIIPSERIPGRPTV